MRVTKPSPCGDLYRAIWRVAARHQLVLIALSLSVAALAAAPLKFNSS
jgi:hypothetical protein